MTGDTIIFEQERIPHADGVCLGGWRVICEKQFYGAVRWYWCGDRWIQQSQLAMKWPTEEEARSYFLMLHLTDAIPNYHP